MPTPRLPTSADFKGCSWDVLYAKSDFVIGDFTGTDTFIGSDSTKATLGSAPTTTQANAAFWDVRQYGELQLWMYAATLTGGTSPYVQINLEMAPSPDAAQTSMMAGTGSSGITSTVKTAVIVAGAPVTSAALAGGSYGGSAVMTPFHPPFVRIKYWTSGSPTGITAAAMYLIGIR